MIKKKDKYLYNCILIMEGEKVFEIKPVKTPQPEDYNELSKFFKSMAKFYYIQHKNKKRK
jgi:capsular polysaccharide biosynthesis protein